MGEKGSIKNLYKAWRLFLEEQKKKKKLKKLKKKPSKTKVFFTTFFTFLFSPFFFGRKDNKKNLKKTIKQMDILISEIEKEENYEVLTLLKDELDYEKSKVQELNNKMAKITVKKIEKAESAIEHKLQELELKNSDKIIKTEEKTINNSGAQKLETKIENKEKQNEFKDEKIETSNEEVLNQTTKKRASDEEIINEIPEKQNEKDSKKLLINDISKIKETKIIQKESVILKDPDILEFLNYMKLEINTIEYKLKLDLNIFQLKYLKSRIIDLNFKRENFKSNYDFDKISEIYKSKDKYHILENNDMLELLYKKCELKINNLNQKKTEEKKEEKKEQKNQKDIDLLEIAKINTFLEKEIKKSRLQITKLKLEISKVEKKLRKPTLLLNIKNMIRNSLKLVLSLVPIRVFRNKLVGGLASAFMLNNSIRSIRNLVNEEQIEYAKLLNNINNQKDCIFNTRLVYEDTITQIEFLKYDLLSRFSFTDLKDIFNKLYEIEEELKIKNKLLSNLEIELEHTYEKTRQKVKRNIY